MRSVVVAIIVVLQCCCPTPGQLTESSVRCSAPAEELTKEATVTCLFPHDISQAGTDFVVRHNQSERQRGQDNNHHQMNKVADCMWFKGKLDCSINLGYEHEEHDVTTTSFTLRIPHFLQNHTGQYSCQVDGYDFELCSLLPRKQPSTPGEIATTTTENNHFQTNSPLAGETTSRTAEGEQAVTSLLIIIVSATGAVITLASLVVIAYISYRCYHVKKSVRRTDDTQMAERGAHESQNFVDVGQSERTPTPETNSGQHADVTTSLLSEADRSVLRHCCSSIQQEQIKSRCSHGQNRGVVCDCSRHSSAPDGYVTLGNHGKCGGSDVKLSVQGKSVCCEGCPTTRQNNVTRDNEEDKLDGILAYDKMFSEEQSCTKKEEVNTPEKIASYPTCHVCQEKIKALHWGHDMSDHKGHTVSEEANHSHHDDKILATVRMREECESTLTAAAS